MQSGTSFVIHSGVTIATINADALVSGTSSHVFSGTTIAYYGSPQVVERIVYRDRQEPRIITKEIIKEVPGPVTKETIIKEVHHYHEREEGMSLTSIGGIVLVIVICLITVKFIAPRITLRNAVRWFWHLIWKPGRKAKNEVSSEWDKVRKEDKE